MRFLNRSAGRLSRHRRRPVAGLLLLMLGLVLTGSLYAAFAPSSTADSAKSDQELADAGRKLFLVSCATCHGQNGEGVLSQDGNQLGPSLVGVGGAAADFQLSTGRMPAVQPGAQNPTKPVTFDDDGIAGPGPRLATYAARAAISSSSKVTGLVGFWAPGWTAGIRPVVSWKLAAAAPTPTRDGPSWLPFRGLHSLAVLAVAGSAADEEQLAALVGQLLVVLGRVGRRRGRERGVEAPGQGQAQHQQQQPGDGAAAVTREPAGRAVQEAQGRFHSEVLTRGIT